MFKKATREQCKLRLLLEGASGSGKTYGALVVASQFSDKIALIDTENASASLYSDKFSFDTCQLEAPFTPEKYIEAIKYAEKHYDVIVIDSISHEWIGSGGCLDIHGQIGGNTFTAWKKVTPRHDAFIDALLFSSAHIICTARSKTEYALVENDRGKMMPVKQGTAIKQRDGLDYEMTTVFTLNQNNLATATKDRTSLFVGKDHKISAETGKILMNWLNSGEAPVSIQEPEQEDAKDYKVINSAIESADNMADLASLYESLSDIEKSQYKSKFADKRKKLEETN